MYSRVALAMVAFSANSVLCRLALHQQHIDPVSFSGLRIAGGALIPGLMLLGSRTRRSPEFSWVNASLLSAYVFAFSVAYVAIDTGTGALLLFGTVQLIMSAWGLYKGEKMTVLKATGVAMAVAGIGILLLPSAAAPSPSAALLMAISHVKRLFEDDLYAIEKLGAYPVRLAGRTFVIRQQLVDDIQQQKVAEKVFRMNKPLLVFHAPEDDTVLIEQAEHIFRSARHPKSFISLHGADHLLSDNKDADYVGECIVAWSSRYLDITP